MQRIRLKQTAGERLKLIIKGTCADYATLNHILTLCAVAFGVSVEDIKGKCRKKEIVKARHAAAFLIKQHTRLTLELIGEQLGGRDHTSILHAVNCVKDSIKCQDNHIYPYMESLQQQVSDYLQPAPVSSPFPAVSNQTRDYLTTVCLS